MMCPFKQITLLPVLGVALLAGCNLGGGSGGVVAGIEGTGSPQSGIEGTGLTDVSPPTALSSMHVDGMAFDIGRADIIMNGQPVSADALRPGMVLKVTGQAADDGQSIVAERVEFDRALYGPIDTVDPETQQLAMLGQPVQMDASTVLEGVPEEGPMPGQLCLVSGMPGATGGFLATLLSCGGGYAPQVTAVEAEGPVHGLDLGAGHFYIGDLAVLFHDAALDLSAGALADDAWVEVVGRQPGPGLLQADRLRIKDGGGEAGQALSLEGVLDR